MRRLCWLLLPLWVNAPARADDARTPILLLHRDFPSTSLFELQREATARGVEVAVPEPRAEPASETLLADIRPLWRDMAWAKAAAKLDEAVDQLIRGREPTAGVVRALAEIELWRGACSLLLRKTPGAADHFVLARQLWPGAQLEPIFPPKVRAAFKAARPARPVRVAVRLAPAGARLWFDGRAVDGQLSAAPGLHYAVVTRADMVPVAQLVRITKSGAQVSMTLREQAPAADMLRAARWWSTDRAVLEAIGRPVFMVAHGEGRLRVTPLHVAAGGEPAVIDAADAAKVVSGICEAAGGCSPPPTLVESPPGVTPAGTGETNPAVAGLGKQPPPAKPVWKKGWFWGVVGAGVVVLAGVATGAALGATLPRDYVVRVR